MAGSNGLGSFIDTALDELLEFFRECEQWVPIVGPVLEMLVEIPEGREQELYDLADYYGQAVDLHRQHAEQVQTLLGDLRQTWQGDGGAQATHEKVQQYLEQLNADAESFAQMQQMVHSAALGVEAAKMMDVVNLVMLAMATVEVIATIIETVGLSAIGEGLAIATCRQAIKTALKELVEKLIGQGFKGAVKAIMKAGLQRGLQFVKFTVATKLGILGIQAAEGHDPMTDFDPIEFAGEIADSFVAGFLGGPLAVGAHNPLSEGTAMALGQLGDNYLRLYRDDLFDALNLTDWAKDHNLYVDRDHFDPLDGVATAGLFGAVLGAKGMREGLRDAGADLRLKLGEKNTLGTENSRFGTAEPAPRTAGETGTRAGAETGSRAASGESSATGRSSGSPGSDQGAATQRSAGSHGSERSAGSRHGSERSTDTTAADQRAHGDQRTSTEHISGTERRAEPAPSGARAPLVRAGAGQGVGTRQSAARSRARRRQ
ncbi:hypothetical protein [Actinoplanes sp. NPDC020271]|uniref:WXG100-like domain-containing protein n=1 Tax=Actinoplanes sp. NPDC020271 TaxID=3363896 RepID=UPI0037AC833D